MSLRSKIFFILLALTGAAFIGQSFVLRTIVAPQFVQLEEQGAKRDMRRIQQAIFSELQSLDILCHDWAVWADVVEFVEGRGRDSEVRNIPHEFFKLAFVDYLHFVDQQGQTIYRKSIDPVTGDSFRVDGFAGEGRPAGSLLFLQKDVDKDVRTLIESGLIYVAGVPEPLLLVARPILTSANKGPIHGTLIMGRFLNRPLLQQKIGVNLDFLPVAELTGDEAEVLALLQSGAETPVLRHVDDLIYFYSLQHNIYGSSFGLIVGQKPAEIIQHGHNAIRTTMRCYLVVSIVFLLAVFFLLSRIVTQPLHFLCDQTRTIVKTANFAGKIKITGQGEVAALGQSINDLLGRIMSHEQLLLSANNKLLEQSLTDALTELTNRRGFDVYIEKEMARMQRNKLPLSVLMCDVDYFKKYNDTYGHQEGDNCLHTLATTLTEVVSRPADLPARYGGEEFVLVLPETAIAGARHVAQKICEAIQGLHIEHSDSASSQWVTMSIGVASIIPDGHSTPDSLVKMADKALYQAKEQGRNRVVVFEE